LSRGDGSAAIDLPEREFRLPEAHISAIVEAGEGRPVLFIHGNSSSKEIWAHQMDAVASCGRPVMALDLPGHGKSSNARTPSQTYSFPGYAAIVSQLLDSLAWPSVDVVGWSLGGHIGLELLGSEPRLNSLLIVGTPPARPSPDALQAAFKRSDSMGLTGKREFTQEDVTAYATKMLGGEKWVAPHLLSAVRRTDGEARHYMFMNAMSGLGADQRDVVETEEAPLCVVHGEREPFVRLDYLRSIDYKNLWGGEVFVIADAGHAPHWQRPREFNRILLSFLDR
jgi:pimeloyl-ACP methyl ester carboxylesterase